MMTYYVLKIFINFNCYNLEHYDTLVDTGPVANESS